MNTRERAAAVPTTKETKADNATIARLEALLERQQETIDALRSKRRVAFIPPKKGRGPKGFVRVTWGDSHGMRADNAALAAAFHDFAILRPTEVVSMGDHLDCDGFLSAHPPVGYKPLSSYSFDEDIEATNDHFDRLAKSAPDAKVSYIEGNHEHRIEAWCYAAADNDRDRDRHRRMNCPPAVLSLESRGVAYYTRGRSYDGLRKTGTIRKGKCLFTHGDYHGRHAATAHLQATGANVWYGHTHRYDAVLTHNEGAGTIGAWNPGCLCELQPMYAHGRPMGWTHGYGVQFVGPDGSFLPLLVPIIDGVSYLAPLLKTLGVKP
jgi:hypothetical protein